VTELSLLNGRISLIGALTTIALIVMAVAVMLGIIKRGDSLKHLGALLCVMILLTVLPGILIHSWAALTIWQQIGLLAIGVGIYFWRLSSRRSRVSRRAKTD
jgi:hypothetical protein